MQEANSTEIKKKRTRRLKYGEKTQSISARLPESQVKTLQELGEGCLSKGIILASRFLEKVDAEDLKRIMHKFETDLPPADGSKH